MKLFYYYKDIKLGSLQFDGENFVYNSIVENEIIADKKYLTFKAYRLRDSFQLTSNKLFSEFDSFLNATKREDLKNKAGIESGDNEFLSIYKLSKLRLNYDEFNIRAK